jgi:histidinol-phosphate aminotransferase
MSMYLSELAGKIKPYTPGEQPRDKKYIKLNTNENPYPPSPLVTAAIRAEAGEDLRLYPDPQCLHLRQELASYYGLKAEQVFVGNGSDEILAFCFLAFFDPGRAVVFPDISYSFYPVYASLFKIDFRPVPLNEDFSVPVELFSGENGGVILANPNSPTGKCLSAQEVVRILENNKDSVVIIDEAYIDYGGESVLPFIPRYPNLLVIRTFSKSRSLAGLRVGFALGNEALIEGLERIKNSFNSYTLDRLALAGAAASLKDEEYFQKTRALVIRTREEACRKLKELGFLIVESAANFIFIRHPGFPARDLFKKLREQGILVRHYNLPRIDDYLRVTIGTDEEMETFVKTAGCIISGF